MLRRLFINRSIRTKIVWSSVLISLVPMLILSFLFYQTSARSLERTMVRSADQNAGYVTDYLNQYFRNLSTSALQVYGEGFKRIREMMDHGTNYNDADLINLNEALKNYYTLVQSKNKDIIKVMIYGKDNVLRDSWSRAASYDAITLNPSVPHADEILNLPFQHAIMFSYRDPVINQDLFLYAMTIYDPFYRTKFGTFVFYIRQKEFVRMMEAYNRPPNALILQNQAGEAFYRTNGDYDDAAQMFASPFSPAPNRGLGLHFTAGRELLVGTSMLDNGRVGLTLVYPSTELEQNRKNILRITVVVFAAVMVIIALFSMLAQQFITRPIQRLGKAMKAVRGGNFHVSLPPYPWRDDLSELTRNFNFMTDKIRELIESEYQTKLRNKEAQILALQMQINPHFLYNTLQTIGGKAVLIGEYEIHEMCRALGDMFRYNFYEGNTESTLGLELTHVNNYLYIQQLRFDESIVTEFDVQDGLSECRIIRFVLQPIIENAVIHVLGKREHPKLCINVKAERLDNNVVITVRDNGPGMERDKLDALLNELGQKATKVFSGVSIGLKNVHERIRLVYGAPYGLKIDSAAGEGTTVTITIPYKNRGTDHV